MKVLMIRSKTLVEVNDAYGERLIEQGEAVLPGKEPEAPKAEAPKEEAAPKTEKTRKGDPK